MAVSSTHTNLQTLVNALIFMSFVVLTMTQQALSQTSGIILIGPSNASILIESSARLHCRFTNKINGERGNADTQVFEGGRLPLVQWMKDGFGYQNVSMQTTFNSRYFMPGPFEMGIYDLVISSVDLEDDAQFVCQAHIPASPSLPSSLLTSDPAQLSIIVPPTAIDIHQKGLGASPIASPSISTNKLRHRQQISQPGFPGHAEVWGPEGREVLVFCTVRASRPSAQIEWHLEGRLHSPNHPTDINTWTEPIPQNKFMNMTVSSLRLRLTFDLQGSLLECKVRNARIYSINKDIVKASATINIQYIRNVVVSPQPTHKGPEYREDDIISFNCHGEAYPTPVTYSWNLFNPRRDRIHQIIDATQTPALGSPTSGNMIGGTLRLRVTREMHRMMLRCVVSSTLHHLCTEVEGGSVLTESQSKENCTQKYTVQATGERELLVLYAPIIRDTIQTTVAANVGELVTLNCLVDANPPALVAWYRGTPQTGQLLIATTARHVIRVTSETLFGVYTCVVRSPGFPDATKVVYMGQAGAPKIVSKEMIYAHVGQTAKISCSAKAIPQPRREDVKWLQPDGSHVNNPRFHIYQESFLQGITSVIYISKLHATDFGPYNCSVENDYGIHWKVITLCPADEAPLAFAVGSGVAVVFALCFSFIIVCIVKKGKPQSPPSDTYYKEMSLADGHRSGEVTTPSECYPPETGGIEPPWKDPTRQVCFAMQMDPNNIDRYPTIRKVEWREDGTYQDGSTRSADSGVGPDDTTTSSMPLNHCNASTTSHHLSNLQSCPLYYPQSSLSLSSPVSTGSLKPLQSSINYNGGNNLHHHYQHTNLPTQNLCPSQTGHQQAYSNASQTLKSSLMSPSITLDNPSFHSNGVVHSNTLSGNVASMRTFRPTPTTTLESKMLRPSYTAKLASGTNV